MKLQPEFYKLPLRFDVTQLAEEIAQFGESDWTRHHDEAAGNASIILVSVGGTRYLDFAISGPMKPTPYFSRCPYLKQLLQALDTPLSRCRLVRLAGQSNSPSQAEHNYHWFRRRPIYVPIITDPAVKFFCHDKEMQMAAGDAWTFDHRKPHRMVNETAQACIHLVIETKGQPSFLQSPPPLSPPNIGGGGEGREQVRYVPYQPGDHDGQLSLEPYSFEVLTPPEITELTADILAETEATQIPQPDFLQLAHHISELRDQWASTFSRFGHQHRGELAYQDLILSFKEQIASKANKWLRNSEGKGKYAISVINSMLLPSRPARRRVNLRFLKNKRRKAKLISREFDCPKFDRPLFIISAPRAGSTLLFETLSHLPDLWTIGEESHETIEGIAELHPAARHFASNRLTEADASPQLATVLRKRFARQLQDRQGRPYLDLPLSERPTTVRFLEKTPKNALRIPFLKALFPEARFIYLYREPKSNISSMLEGWRLRRFITYDPLPGWPYRTWCFLLIPGWEALHSRSLREIAAHQWQLTNAYILDDLQTLPRSDWCLVHYAALVREPKKIMRQIAQFAELRWDQHINERVSQSLPLSSVTVSAPSPDKWRKNEWELNTILPLIESFLSKRDILKSPTPSP